MIAVAMQDQEGRFKGILFAEGLRELGHKVKKYKRKRLLILGHEFGVSGKQQSFLNVHLDRLI